MPNDKDEDNVEQIELTNGGGPIKVVITNPTEGEGVNGQGADGQGADGAGGYVNLNFDKSDLVDGDLGNRRGSKWSEVDFPGTILPAISGDNDGSGHRDGGEKGDPVNGQSEALHLITTSKAPIKDFTLEVRATLDIKHYLSDLTIELECQQLDGHLYNLTNHLLKKVRLTTFIFG